MNSRFALCLRKRYKACLGLALALLFLLSPSAAWAQEHSEDCELLWSYEAGSDVLAVSVSSDGSYIVAGSRDNKVYLFNREGNLLWSYKTGDFVYGVSISPDAFYIAAGSSDNKIYFFNRQGNVLWSYEAGSEVFAVSVSSDGSYITAGSLDDKVYLFNREGNLLWSYDTGDALRAVSVSPDGSYIAAGGYDGKVYFFNRDGELLWSYETAGVIFSLSISSDGSHIAVASDGDKAYFFTRDGDLLWSYKRGEPVCDVSASLDGFYIAIETYDKAEVCFFNWEGDPLWNCKIAHSIAAVSLSSDGSYIAVGTYGTKVYFFSTSGLAQTAPTPPPTRVPTTTPTISSMEASRVIGVARASIEMEKSKGLKMVEAEDLVSQAQQAFEKGDYEYAKGLAELARILVPQIAVEATRAKDVIDATVDLLSEQNYRVFNLVEAEDLVSQAQQAFESGDYKNAKDLALQAKNLVHQIVEEATPAKDAIGIAKASIEMEKSKGLKMVEAEDLVSQAQQAFEKGDYQTAEQLALEANRVALDIDSDRIPNENDFAPTVNNNYIYAFGVTFILSLIVFVSVTIRRKRRAKQAIEEQKSGIIAMIDEALEEKKR